MRTLTDDQVLTLSEVLEWDEGDADCDRWDAVHEGLVADGLVEVETVLELGEDGEEIFVTQYWAVDARCDVALRAHAAFTLSLHGVTT